MTGMRAIWKLFSFFDWLKKKGSCGKLKVVQETSFEILFAML